MGGCVGGGPSWSGSAASTENNCQPNKEGNAPVSP